MNAFAEARDVDSLYKAAMMMKRAALEDVARYGCRASFQVYRAGLLLRSCVEGRHTKDAHVVVTRLCAARAATSRESPSSSLLYVAEIIERRRVDRRAGSPLLQSI